MKTLKLFSLLLVTGLIAFSSCNQPTTETTESETTEETGVSGTMNIDLASSDVKWKGEMMGMYEHTGIIKISDGSVTFDNGAVSGGEFTVDMTSIMPTDKNYKLDEGKTPEKLVGHLSSPDFFDVTNNPTAKFVVTSGDATSAKGTLTVRGKSNEETIKNIVVSEKEGKYMISGDLTFNRKNYDVAFDMPVKDMVLSNDIALKVELVASK